MSHGTNPRSHRTTVRVPDAVEHLITAWLHWEATPTSRAAVLAKLDAIVALGLGSNETHEHIADRRRQGYSIADAVQSIVNDDKPLKEAS